MTKTFLQHIDNDPENLMNIKPLHFLCIAFELFRDQPILANKKALHTRVFSVEQENEQLKQLSAGLQESVDNQTSKVNLP